MQACPRQVDWDRRTDNVGGLACWADLVGYLGLVGFITTQTTQPAITHCGFPTHLPTWTPPPCMILPPRH